uniref:PITH domain-containing protein n=1 Tax=Macrostomum lignano TaxID=282301 RepID=A0A1I8FDB9_9PLAT
APSAGHASIFATSDVRQGLRQGQRTERVCRSCWSWAASAPETASLTLVLLRSAMLSDGKCSAKLAARQCQCRPTVSCPTPRDLKASMRLFADADTLMSMLMRELQVPVCPIGLCSGEFLCVPFGTVRQPWNQLSHLKSVRVSSNSIIDREPFDVPFGADLELTFFGSLCRAADSFEVAAAFWQNDFVYGKITRAIFLLPPSKGYRRAIIIHLLDSPERGPGYLTFQRTSLCPHRRCQWLRRPMLAANAECSVHCSLKLLCDAFHFDPGTRCATLATRARQRNNGRLEAATRFSIRRLLLQFLPPDSTVQRNQVVQHWAKNSRTM